MIKRVFVIVLDSFGVGQEPDCALFGDRDCNTLKRIASSPKFYAPNLEKLGLFHIDGIDCQKSDITPVGAYGKAQERSMGKDTTTGHWELAGIISPKPMPTYPNGFPKEILDEFSRQTGRGVLCNKPYSGTQVIADYGQEHCKTGKLIVYTSADSVFQIAAHEDIVPVETLYEYCQIARKILCGKNAVGRVIARPFTGSAPNFVRTARRHDFSLLPPSQTMLDDIQASKKTVYAIGKIDDIFASRGIDIKVYTHSNEEGMERTLQAQATDFCGLCFVNLVDFDMLYGHRQDIDGYAEAISRFDRWLPSFLQNMKKDDVLLVTADHGCDPGDSHTDHTREYIPILVYGERVVPKNLKIRDTYADVSAFVCDCLGVKRTSTDGTSFYKEIIS